ncbi:uncharacterized protein EV420DRAFT_1622168 [Desarmillaria tabescens]|uniref:Uncharacterized protein n=1 Tax=Armillaria tabescens TaxID=1929756 RepID=A0AA39JYQ6_ARMTA|nr:uncharacterized protein EV420DRAFT_1622168 [Desarmillaria tabescens]KAK0449038.1 hypothetical protein EV420DRAFT_1622168 [Desarmillaria tabescens]
MSSRSNSQTKMKQNGNLMKPVSAPLSSTRLSRLIYLLVVLSAILTAYYSFRIVQWKTEVGGWWNPSTGQRPHAVKIEHRTQHGRVEGVEDHINALAEALGMPSKDLARAIAGAVREYVPPASLSALKEKETGSPVEAAGIVGGVMSGVESFVGMDEP